MSDPAALAAQRRHYDRARLDDGAVAGTWLEQLRAWFDAASADPGVLEANAVALATASADGMPAVRTVLAKAIDERGVVFYTNHDSAKGRELAANPYASLLFVWLPHERQVRLSGPVEQVPGAETEAYFATRPRESQLGAWASPQSQPVASRTELDEAYAQVERRFGDEPIPPPPNWGGFVLRPVAVEFWQGRGGRLHDRIRFRAEGTSWITERLAP